MPRYDYFCAANGRTVEVRHGMSETIATWGELCERAGHDPGDTPADAAIERKIGGGLPLTRRRGEPVAASGACGCGPSSCGCMH